MAMPESWLPKRIIPFQPMLVSVYSKVASKRSLRRWCLRWRWFRWRGFWCRGLWRRRRPWSKLGLGFEGASARGRSGPTDAQDGARTSYAQYGARATYAEDRTDATYAQYRGRASDAEDTAEAQDAAVAKGTQDALGAFEAEPSQKGGAAGGGWEPARPLPARRCVLA